MSSQSSHHPQEVLLAQFSLYVHKGGLKPDSFHLVMITASVVMLTCVDAEITFKVEVITYLVVKITFVVA